MQTLTCSFYAYATLYVMRKDNEDANGDLVYTFTRPWSDGTTGITLSPLEWLEKLSALIPPPRVHQVHYGGGLAPHSKLRAAIILAVRQQGTDGAETSYGSLAWSWVRLLKRVCDWTPKQAP